MDNKPKTYNQPVPTNSLSAKAVSWENLFAPSVFIVLFMASCSLTNYFLFYASLSYAMIGELLYCYDH